MQLHKSFVETISATEQSQPAPETTSALDTRTTIEHPTDFPTSTASSLLNKPLLQNTTQEPQRVKKRKRQAKENMEQLNALERLQNIATAINNPRNTHTEDEFYYFGQSIAAPLRSLPLTHALQI